jgi:hypothetical protein
MNNIKESFTLKSGDINNCSIEGMVELANEDEGMADLLSKILTYYTLKGCPKKPYTVEELLEYLRSMRV